MEAFTRLGAIASSSRVIAKALREELPHFPQAYVGLSPEERTLFSELLADAAREGAAIDPAEERRRRSAFVPILAADIACMGDESIARRCLAQPAG